MAQKETAEQKLLKIIEASKKAQTVPKGEGASKAPAGRSRRKISFSIRQFNVVLIVCVGASALFFAHEIKTGLSLTAEEIAFPADSAAPKDIVNLFVPRLKSVGYYMDNINSRNIFQPFEKKPEVKEAVQSDRVALEKKMSKFKIVGIAWLDVPESATVMLEDTGTHMTHFLKEGDKVEDVIVKIIYTDRVVFSRANEEITIKL